MNNELTIKIRDERMNMVINESVMMACRPLRALTGYYSKVLDKKLSTKQTLCLLNAQCAFLSTVFVDCSLVARTFLFAWLVGALLKCKESL